MSNEQTQQAQTKSSEKYRPRKRLKAHHRYYNVRANKDGGTPLSLKKFARTDKTGMGKDWLDNKKKKPVKKASQAVKASPPPEKKEAKKKGKKK